MQRNLQEEWQRTLRMLEDARRDLDPGNFAWLGEIDAMIELQLIEEEKNAV